MSSRHRSLSAPGFVVSLSLSLAAVALVACGSTDDLAGESPGTGADASVGGSAGAAGNGGQAGAAVGGSAGQTGEAGSAGAAGDAGAAGAAGGSVATDPSLDGPYSYSEIDATADVPATGNKVPLHVFLPDGGPSSAPYPMVTLAHGFQLPPGQYYSYGKRLASFGYVAVSVDFPASLVSANHLNNAKDIVGAIDWALAQSAASGNDLSGKIDAALIGATGHSLGGKASLLAATLDPRIKASITLDPIDTTPPFGCDDTKCPDVSAMLGVLKIPTGFLGETTDSAAGLQPCAPAADNYQTFYAAAPSPSLEVTVNGANHMSFLDDAAGCGLVCSVCKQATLPNDQVNALSRAFVVAFYERHLRANAGFETWLTGADAQAKYVTPGTVTITSK